MLSCGCMLMISSKAQNIGLETFATKAEYNLKPRAACAPNRLVPQVCFFGVSQHHYVWITGHPGFDPLFKMGLNAM